MNNLSKHSSWKFMCEQLDKELGIKPITNRWLNPNQENTILLSVKPKKELNNTKRIEEI